MQDLAQKAEQIIRKQLPKGFIPKVGIILGSGLGGLADKLDIVAEFSYADLPGFFVSTVAGHAGKLLLGNLNNVPVMCYQGRVHLYEGADISNICHMLRTFKRLGGETLIVTGATGSLNIENDAGSVVMLNDQINFQGQNALLGQNDDNYGPRFSPMENAYDYDLRQVFHKVAQEQGANLPEGVYIGVLGPSYETPAEIKAFKILGADVIGMSVVNEVIVARHCGLKVAGFAVVTNLCSGLGGEEIDHSEVLVNANKAASTLEGLVLGALKDI